MQDLIQSQSEQTDHVITIESIYDSASEIGEHFKKLIQLFGAETFEALIPIVVRTLEQLEDVTVQRNDCLRLVEKLHEQIDDLQKEHQKRIQEQLKYQSEIEDIDDLWRKENRKLEQYVKYLKNENNRLNVLRNNEKFSQSLIDLKPDENTKEEAEKKTAAQKDLSDTQCDKLKTKLRILNNEIDLKNEEIENLKTENENLKQENKNLRKIVSMSLNSIIGSEDDNQTEPNQENELKDKIRILEDIVRSYKLKLESKERQDHQDVECAVEAIVHDVIDPNNNNDGDNIKMEDLPVQGPIPKEPDEKLYWSNGHRKSSSRIWSFFPRLTKALIK